MKYGLIGGKLGHSYSPEIHAKFGIDGYELHELESEDIPEFFRERDFTGINVTIPYKVTAFEYCDEVSEIARRIGCVNTIVKRKDGSLYGDNTDYYGFRYLVEHNGIAITGKKVLILGTGGASKSVRTVMEDLGAGTIQNVSRSGEINYTSVYNRFSDASVIVNCTPVGMYPKCEPSLVNLTKFQRLTAVFDCIYNPARTDFMLSADRDYVPNFGGLDMLVAQAAKSAELFDGRKRTEEEIADVVGQIDREKRNIILIGMPGCGKTSIGRVLAEKLSREFIDLDDEIEKCTGRSPADIIRSDGEPAFREIESKVLESFAKMSGKVISCGGGVISPKKNRSTLKMNAFVVWIQRDINELATEGRPLSEIIGTHELYRYREPLYIESCDYTILNSGTIEEAADRIYEIIGD